MKIAYSCAGEGFGHVSRMSVLLPHLEKIHDVRLFLPVSTVSFLESKVGRRPSTPIPGVHYVQKADRVRWGASFRALIPTLITAPWTIARLVLQLRRERIQAVISDYEPLLAWAGFWAGIPVFQLNHPGILTRIPTRGGWWASLGSRLLEGPWTERVLVSFFAGDVGPLLRPSLTSRTPLRGPELVVHLKDSYRAKALAVLANVPGLRYRVFPSPGQDFDSALLECAGVVTPAGHQVLAEALALGKPVLALPQSGQPEQWLNAQQLIATGRGQIGSLETLSTDLATFVGSLDQLAQVRPLGAFYKLSDGTPALLARIERFLAREVAV